MSSLGPKQYDAFLSYNSQDRAAVEALARRLRDEGLRLYLEVWELAPGREFQSALTEGIGDSQSCVVFLGPNGLGPWQYEEVQVVINRRAHDGEYRVIPVLLPGFEVPRLGEITRLAFLLNARWVEFFRTLDDEQALRELVWGIRGTAPEGPSGAPPVGECPYRGLEAFGPGDARLFFGRKKLTAWLVSVLRRGVRIPQGVRFLGVLGPSGSGKSSVALAGLVAWLKEGAIEGSARWPVAILRPGKDPLQSLARALVIGLDPTNGSPDIATTLRWDAATQELAGRLAADTERLYRFAETALHQSPPRRGWWWWWTSSRRSSPSGRRTTRFAQAAGGAVRPARDAFLANLLHAATTSGGRVAVVMTMRSDFLGAAHLRAAQRRAQRPPGAGRADDRGGAARGDRATCVPRRLRRRAGADRAAAGRRGGSAGGVAALAVRPDRNLEARDVRDTLTLRAYEKLGENERGEQRGIEGVLDRRANAIYGHLPVKDQELCKRLFLRLVQPGEGTRTPSGGRRSASSSRPAPRAKSVESVVSRLADARLITTWADPKTSARPGGSGPRGPDPGLDAAPPMGRCRPSGPATPSSAHRGRERVGATRPEAKKGFLYSGVPWPYVRNGLRRTATNSVQSRASSWPPARGPNGSASRSNWRTNVACARRPRPPKKRSGSAEEAQAREREAEARERDARAALRNRGD